MTSNKRAALISIAALATGLLSVQAHAQTRGNEGDQKAAPSSDAALPDIVVTAQRKSENAQKVPVALTVLSSDQLVQMNMKSVEAIQLATPGFIYNAGYGYAQNYIRGVGTDLPNLGLESAVGVYVDGVYLPRAVGGTFDLVDNASLQVLKGPQGTLYGRNATGGAILITTADPGDSFSLKASGEYGRFNHALGEMALNVPISDTLSARVATRYSQEDGYIHNLAGTGDLGQRKVFDIRGKLRWKATPDLTAILTLEHSYSLDGTGGAFAERYDYPICGFCAAPGVPARPTGFYEVNLDHASALTNEANSANLRLIYSGDTFTVQTVTSYRHENYGTQEGLDQDYTSLNVFNYRLDVKSKTFQQDLQVSSNFHSWIDFTVGASYLWDSGNETARLDGSAFDPLVTAFGSYPTAQNKIVTNSYSAYGELYLTPIERLKITAGGRFTRDKRSLSASNNDAAAAALAPPGSPQSFQQKASFDSFTPRFVVAYDLDVVNLYASFNKGFKAGGFASPAFAPVNAVRPEKIDSYEVGAKFVSPDRRFNLNLAAFLYNYSDVQRSVVGPSGVFIFQNAAKARGKGVELDGQFTPTSWFNLSAGVAYLAAKYRSFPGASISVPAAGGGLMASSTDLSGYPLSRAPKWTAYVTPSFHFELPGGWKARLNGVGRYTSAYDFYPGRGGPLGYNYQAKMFIANLTGGITTPDDRYDIGFYIDNLTNKKYAVQRADAQSAFGVVETVAKPRTYGVRFTVKLD